MTRIRIRHGDNEIELEGDLEFIKVQLKAFYEKLDRVGSRTSPATLRETLLETAPRSTGPAPAPAEFYRLKGHTDGVSQILIFAKFLELYRDTPEFTRAQVNKVAKEAKLSKDIHSQYFTNAVKQGLLRSSGNRYSLTLSAEETLSKM